MKRKILASLLIAAMCFCPVTASAATFQIPDQKDSKTACYEEGEAIVLLKDSQSGMSRKATAASLGVSDIQVADACNFKHAVKEESSHGSSARPKGISQKTTTIALVRSENLSTEKLLEKLKASGQVEIAAPNYQVKACKMPNDPYITSQWALKNSGQTAGVPGADLHPERLWDKGTKGSSKVVAVIDTGVDYTHEDLVSNMWVNPYQSKLPGKYGYDFVNEDADPMDDRGHGTNCAGIIGAAGDNGVGISGINQKIKIMALKFLDRNGVGKVYDALKAYEYISAAQDLGVEVTAINNSYRWFSEDTASEAAAELREINQIFKAAMTLPGKKALFLFADPETKAWIMTALSLPLPERTARTTLWLPPATLPEIWRPIPIMAKRRLILPRRDPIFCCHRLPTPSTPVFTAPSSGRSYAAPLLITRKAAWRTLLGGGLKRLQGVLR